MRWTPEARAVTSRVAAAHDRGAGRGHAGRLERVHLVFHQRDERRDHDREAGAHERGQLEAERFAAAGRQHGKHVLPGERVADDFLLQRAEGTEAEILFQRRA